MWKKGIVEILGQKYEYEAKVFENGSEYGIANGVISKLTIWNQENKEVCIYDRGWVLEPDTFKDLMAYREVLKIFT